MPMAKTKAVIVGSGNIGTDLMIKIARYGKNIELVAVVGVDPRSDGLARAKRMGIATVDSGLEGFRRSPLYEQIGIVFDATSAKAHHAHAEILGRDKKRIIDLTPAALGPYVVPSVNLEKCRNENNINMVTCGGQATIPIVNAVSRVATVLYAEIVASIASKSAGPGTRANIDEFTETTAKAIVCVGGAKSGKAIIVLNPAEPPLVMRDTIYCLTPIGNEDKISMSVEAMISKVQRYVPGYKLKQEIQFERVKVDERQKLPNVGELSEVQKVTVLLEVTGAAHYLPHYAGNLDIMTSAALATAEHVVCN